MSENIKNKVNKLIKSRALWYALFFVLALPLHLYFFEMSNSDEGLVLSHAWRIANGETIYQDFFAYKSPLSFYMVAGLIKIFGANFLIIKFFSVLVLLASLIGIERISSFYLQKPWSFWPSIIYLLTSQAMPLINHNFFNLTIIIWAVYFFLLARQKSTNLLLSVSGFLVGMAWCVLQHRATVVGLGMLLMLAYYALRKQTKIKWKSVLFFTLSAASPVIMLLLLIGPAAFLDNLILFPLNNYSEANKISPVFFYAYLVSLLALLVTLKVKNKKDYNSLLFIQVFLLLSIFARPGIYYIKIISFGTIILFFVLLKNLLDYLPRLTRKYYIIIALSFLFTLFINLIVFQAGNKASGEKYKNLIAFIEENCSDNLLYSGPFSPNLYFITKRKNPTSFSSLITGLHTEEQFLQAKNEIISNPPECVVLDYDMVKQFSYKHKNPLDEYIKNNYVTIKEVEIGHLVSVRKYKHGQ